jgi:hypothetical protein
MFVGGVSDADYGLLSDSGMVRENRRRRRLLQSINLGVFGGTSPALVGRWLVRFLVGWTDVPFGARGAFRGHPGRFGGGFLGLKAERGRGKAEGGMTLGDARSTACDPFRLPPSNPPRGRISSCNCAATASRLGLAAGLRGLALGRQQGLRQFAVELEEVLDAVAFAGEGFGAVTLVDGAVELVVGPLEVGGHSERVVEVGQRPEGLRRLRTLSDC